MHWKMWTLLCTIAWACWGVAAKYAIKGIGWQRLEIISAIAALVIMAVVAPAAFQLKPDHKHLMGFVAGALGALGAILFYLALSTGPVSVVIPVTSLYVVGVTVAGVLLFGEPITFRKVLGVLLATAAVIALTGE